MPLKSPMKKRKLDDSIETAHESPQKTTKSDYAATDGDGNKTPTREGNSIKASSSCSENMVNSSPIQTNISPFKVPLVPKPRKLFSHDSQYTLNPAIIANARAMEEMASSKVTKPSGLTSEKKRTDSINQNPSSEVAAPKDIEQAVLKSENDKIVLLPKTAHSPDMIALCDAIVHKNTRKLSECIQSSLADTLYGFLDAVKPFERIQMVELQMEKQKTEYDSLVDAVQNQNRELNNKLKCLNAEHVSLVGRNSQTIEQNQHLIERVKVIESKNVQLLSDLKGVRAENNKLENDLSQISMKNADSNVKVVKYEATIRDLMNRLHNSEMKIAQLAGENKSLEDINKELTTAMDDLSLKDKDLVNQLKAQSVQMLAEVKKKQWCATCGKPGGRYYCSSHCEEIFW